jgi:hypothetical protein
MPIDEARQALDALDKALRAKPHKDDEDFTAAIKHLSRYRDALTAQFRAAGNEETHEVRARLTRVNAIISTVMAGHFPLGPIPWPEIEKARGALAEIAPP